VALGAELRDTSTGDEVIHLSWTDLHLERGPTVVEVDDRVAFESGLSDSNSSPHGSGLRSGSPASRRERPGKEGVAGSSPAEGSREVAANSSFSCVSRS
jgi:hypothetical protein